MTWRKTKAMRAAFLEHTRLRVGTVPKLPKQWKHWCARLHLRPDGGSRRKGLRSWVRLIGAGRRWRVLYPPLWLQVSCEHLGFDRWANSTAKTYALPTTYTEFCLLVKFTNHDT